MVTKLTDRELNAKLMECLGDNATADVKNAFNSLMKEKVAQIRNEVRQEVFEELSKQAKQDKAKIVESMNDVTNKVINEEMKIPYVSKELCQYLRETYTLQMVLHQSFNVNNADIAVGLMYGINTIIERLEAIQAQQEENDGIH